MNPTPGLLIHNAKIPWVKWDYAGGVAQCVAEDARMPEAVGEVSTDQDMGIELGDHASGFKKVGVQADPATYQDHATTLVRSFVHKCIADYQAKLEM